MTSEFQLAFLQLSPVPDVFPALGGCPPRGLGTPFVESLSGYVQRLGNTFVIPPGELLREMHSAGAVSDRVRARPRAIDGAGSAPAGALRWLAHKTGRSDLRRCTAQSLSELGGVSGDGLLAATKRWCPLCWSDDGDARYERKLWALALVDVCPVHRALLMDRCPACGRCPPAVSHDVRIGSCGLCGYGLDGQPVVLTEPLGVDAERRVWFSEQAGVLIHAFDVAELLGVDAPSMAAARGEGLRALVDSVEGLECHGALAKRVQGWLERGAHPTLEALFSVLWRARWPVVELFPGKVRSVLEAPSARRDTVPSSRRGSET